MAFKKRYGRKSFRRGKVAHRKARRAFRKALRLPKKVLAKKYANTVGQIVYKSGRRRPSHKRY